MIFLLIFCSKLITIILIKKAYLRITLFGMYRHDHHKISSYFQWLEVEVDIDLHRRFFYSFFLEVRSEHFLKLVLLLSDEKNVSYGTIFLSFFPTVLLI